MARTRTSLLRRAAATIGLCAVSACGAGGDAQGNGALCASSAGLIDGNAAPEAEYAAIGSLGQLSASGDYRAFCSAALIAPALVLTAKHCTMVTRAPLFALGPNAKAPERLIAVLDLRGSEPQTGGVAELGSDVAVGRLAEAVTNIAPLRVARVTPDELMGIPLRALGYGSSDACGEPSDGLRRVGQQVVTSLSGNVFDHIYGDYATYLDAVASSKPPAAAERRYLHGWLLAGYEAWVESGRGHTQICKGDSGGPILRMSGPSAEIVGVSSWVWHSDRAVCDYGAVIALIGPQTQQLIAAALSALQFPVQR
jgi:Trypsin